MLIILRLAIRLMTSATLAVRLGPLLFATLTFAEGRLKVRSSYVYPTYWYCCLIKAGESKRIVEKKGELPRLKCFHNGIILIVICFRFE
jgi:hypothetical protein